LLGYDVECIKSHTKIVINCLVVFEW
jgi:hypothetical protein